MHNRYWSIYGIPTFVGIVFLVVITVGEWHTSLSNQEKEFSLEIVSLMRIVERNLALANDRLNDIVSFFSLMPTDIDSETFHSYTDSILRDTYHIQSINYFLYDGINLTPVFQNNLSSGMKVFSEDEPPITLTEVYQDSLNTALDRGGVFPLFSSLDNFSGYWLLKFQPERTALPTLEKEEEVGTKKIIALLLVPEKLLGEFQYQNKFLVEIWSDTQSLFGRSVLYSTEQINQGVWQVRTFTEDYIAQFPLFSFYARFSRPVYFSDIDKWPLFISILMGMGILLLLLALAHSREAQNEELRNRNRIIEKQVKNQTRELEKVKDQALQAYWIKSDFVASMNHEIRTPMNAIVGISDLLSDTQLSKEQKKYIDVLRNASDTLLVLLNSVLDLSKIEARQMVLEKRNIDLVEVLESVIEMYVLNATNKNIELTYQIDPNISPLRIGDEARLKQVMCNLINNALKFTNQGEVSIHVSYGESVGTEQESDSLRFEVKDTGIGIPQHKQDKIFTSFGQVDAPTNRKYGGTGLGLTISKSLIELMGGSIGLSSEVDVGSTFYFTILLPSQPIPFGFEKNLSGRRFAIIDCHATFSKMIASVLQAKDGDCKIIAQNQLTNVDTTDFDVVFVDSALVFQEQGQIGFKPDGSCHWVLFIPVNLLDEHMNYAKQHDFPHCLAKPVKRNDLIELVETLLIKKATEQVVQAHNVLSTDSVQGQAISSDGKHILLVEDNPDNRFLVKAYLKNTPHTLDEAENGADAINLFKAGKYDLVLMDIKMSGIDGYQATQELRVWEQENAITPTPIIALTASTTKEEVNKCLQAGCNSHMNKPIKKLTFIKYINEFSKC